MVGARILTGDEDQVGLLEIGHRNRSLADADGLGQRAARRLVAHVGTVRHVVGAETANQQLVQERCLVARPPGRVEHGLVGALEFPEMIGDQPVRGIPLDRFVVVAAGTHHHGMRQPALLPQPVIGVPVQFRDRVRCEELGRNGSQRRLLGDGLGAVLAELGGLAVAGRLGPRATRTVEAVPLVEPGEGAGRAGHAHLFHGPLERHEHGGDTGRVVLRVVDDEVVLVDVLPGPGARHDPILARFGRVRTVRRTERPGSVG